VRLLPSPIFVLHALSGHYFASRIGWRDIPLDGLYEFAWWMAHQSAVHGDRMRQGAAGNPRLEAALDFFIAAAADFFSLTLNPPFTVNPKAAEAWRNVKANIGSTR
jgi:hypothetical protein